MNDLTSQYLGFLSTPSLFVDDWVLGVLPFETPAEEIPESFEIPERLRLGQRVEYFFSEYVHRSKHYQMLTNNIQIKRKKVTIGELDFLMKDVKNRVNLHVELVCKFYLFDPNFSDEELKCWIGPNRKDLLIEKVEKLKSKQFPLLYSEEVRSQLNELQLVSFKDEELSATEFISSNFEQRVCYKAQLYVPKELQNKEFEEINPDCIAGYYLTFEELQHVFYKKCSFYIPKKYDWVAKPYKIEEFHPLNELLPKLRQFLQHEYAPMVWCQLPNGQLERFFVVWW